MSINGILLGQQSNNSGNIYTLLEEKNITEKELSTEEYSFFNFDGYIEKYLSDYKKVLYILKKGSTFSCLEENIYNKYLVFYTTTGGNSGSSDSSTIYWADYQKNSSKIDFSFNCNKNTILDYYYITIGHVYNSISKYFTSGSSYHYPWISFQYKNINLENIKLNMTFQLIGMNDNEPY